MSIFLLDIAGVLEVAAIAAGLWLLHLARKEGGGFPARSAAWILIVGGFAIGACTLYYGFRYKQLGYFDAPPKMMMQGQMMGSGMMSSGMMEGGMMMGGKPGSQASPAENAPKITPEEHKAHHP